MYAGMSFPLLGHTWHRVAHGLTPDIMVKHFF